MADRKKEREREREREWANLKKRVSECGRACVCEREGKRERERSDFTVHFSPYDLRFIPAAFLKGPR